MKRIVFTLLLGIMVSTTIAQSQFKLENISCPNDVYLNSGDSAAIVVHSHKSLLLRFFLAKSSSSSGKKKVKGKFIAPTKYEANNSDDYVYYFVFPTGDQYRNQTLVISSPTMSGSVSIIINLEPKQVKTYKVINLYGLVGVGCYLERRNKAWVEIGKGNYAEGLNQLKLASDCSDANRIENNFQIQRVSILMDYRKKGDDAFNNHDFKIASTKYAYLYKENPFDSLAVSRYLLCQEYLKVECDTLFLKADQCLKNEEYKEAEKLYNTVLENANYLYDLDKKYGLETNISRRLKTIKQEMEKKERRTTFNKDLTYEYRKDSWLGFSYGVLKERKTGGFIQIDISPTTLDEIRSACRYGDTKFSETNLAFGWTKKLFKYVWIHWGPGFTGKFYHGTYQNQKYPTIGYGESTLLDTDAMGEDVSLPKNEIPEKYEEAWKKSNFAFAISPVVGIDIKYQFFVLRLTYQYRFATKAKLADFIGRNRISVGVGVAF